jgi:hypothetical protein
MLDVINERDIEVTRGNIMPLTVTALNKDKSEYEFKNGDVIRFKIMKAKDVNNIMFQKDFEVSEQSFETEIIITANEMKIGEVSSKPIDYWYEIELNPDTDNTQTIVGYEKEKGPAILTLLPEGGDSVDKY